MEIKMIKVEDLKPYANNPRFNDDAVEYVAKSINEFGFKVPMVIDKNNEIVAGHTRYKASLELGLKEVPCIIADDLTEEQIKAFRLADNKVSEKAQWNYDLLDLELDDITGIDMSQFDFKALDFEDINLDIEETGNRFSTETKIPQYDIKDIDVNYEDIIDCEKYNQLINEIENANISEEDKKFLELAATRHIRFNYRNIAEFYVKADKEVQELMEKSALVFIDFDDAIANGYVKLTSKISEAIENDNE